ncbi:oocyte zinc finger protein XlCOF6-like isoform X14 [Pectinophora gossypiella]|uniref:oocyte zinc finger protein XlCOF6-like isoform X14 n=1 Tax=Pectinophora gossypiella TaxID=13191 RepID=UPI00214F0E67|nr:oocyte zinc finger protein XlCOF6-like isoform X14 [Pectinophora gossypiella]
MTAKSSDWRPGPSVCRCCFAEGCYKDISTEYFWMGKREVYQEMLSTTFDVSISYAQSGGPNSNSRLICEPCIARLRDASDFKRQVQECERVFHQHLDPTSSVSELEAVVVEPPGKEVKLERVKVESKLSDDEDFDDHAFVDDDDDDLDDQPLTALATKVPKKESVDLMDLLDNAKPEKRKAAAKPKTPPAKKAKKKESPKPSASKPAPKPVEKKRKGVTLRRSESMLKRIKVPRRNAEAVLQFSTVYPFRMRGEATLICVYCLETYTDPHKYRSHLDNEHQDFSVSTAFAHCKGKESLKVDCTGLKCRVCFEPFETIEEVAKHIYENHDCKDMDLTYDISMHPYKLVMGKWACFLCDKKVPSLVKLCRHTTTHFLKYTCDICGKNYLTNEALKYHIKCNHIGRNVCRKCWQEFPTAELKSQHVRESPSCKPFLCLTCGARFISWEQREKHKGDVHGLPKRIYHCPECGDTFYSRKSFYGHYKLAHTDESFMCSCCGLKFDAKYKLDDHVSGHTGEKSFKCDVCLKAFSREKNLKQHIWIHSETKRFSCVVCNKQFAQKVSLKSHMRSYHPDIEVIY